jgi:inosine-uridine nucleoside N-ribohydrolase
MSSDYLAAITKGSDKGLRLLSDLSQFYIDFYRQRVGLDGMAIHDSCACVYVVAPELFEYRSGPVRVVCGGLADGKTIQAPDSGRKYDGSAWDGQPSQSVAVGVQPQKVLEVIRDTLVTVPSAG